MAQNVQVVAEAAKKCSDDYYISRKDRYKFVTHPIYRRKIQCRLLRQLQQLIDEFTVCVGQQIVLIDYPRPPPQFVDQHNRSSKLRIYGAKPLQCIMDQLAPKIISNLDQSLVQLPVNSNLPISKDQSNDDSSKFQLPLISDGSTTSLARMKQSQLRTFIPLMIKYSTGRRKIRWGRQASKPNWWPSNVPWENVRCDARSEAQKSQMSWTMALRQIVTNCYKYHQREDLLIKQADPVTLSQSDDNNNTQIPANSIRVESSHSAYANIDQQIQDKLQTSRIQSNYQKRRRYKESRYQLGRLQPRLPLSCKGSSKRRGNLFNDDNNELIRRQNLIFNSGNAECKTIGIQHRLLLNEDTDHQMEDDFSTAGSSNSVNNYQSNDDNMYDQSHLTIDFSNGKLPVYPQENNTNQNESIPNLNNHNLTNVANDQNTSRHNTDCLQHRTILNLDHNYQRNPASDSEICPCHQHQAAHHARNIARQGRSCSFVDGNLNDFCRSCVKHAGCQLSCAMCSNTIAGTCLNSNNSIVCGECHSKASCCTTSERFSNNTFSDLNTSEHLANNQQCRYVKDNVADIINNKICSQEPIGECKSHSSCCINNCQISQAATPACVIHQSSGEIDQNLSTCSLQDGNNRMTYATHINPKGNHIIGEKNQGYLLSYDTDHNSRLKSCTSCNLTSKSQETLNLDRDPDNEPNQVLRILNPDGSVTALPLNRPMVATVSDRQLSISVQQNPS